MKRFRGSVAVVAVAAMAAVFSVVSAVPSNAATTPPWVPDLHSKGTLTFYDASGNVLTGGTVASGYDLSHIADYAVASTAGTASVVNTKATLYFAVPDSSKPTPLAWPNVAQSSASTRWPVTSIADPLAPTVILNATTPVASLGGTDGNAQVVLQTASLDNSPGYAGILEVRVKDSGVLNGQVYTSTDYYSADIAVDTVNNSWSLVYPAPPAQVTTSVADLTPSPASGATAPVSLSLSTTVSATDSSHPAGSVHFFDGSTDLGAATSWDATTGAASISGLNPSVGSHSYTAAFTPTDSATYAGSTSNALTYSVVAGSSTISTAVSAITPSSPSNSNAPVVLSLTATVTAADSSHPAGSVHFFDGVTDLGAAVFTQGTGVANISALTPVVGSHSYTAVFTPADGATYTGNTSAVLSYVVKPAVPVTQAPGTTTTGSHYVGGRLNCVKGPWLSVDASTSYAYTWWANGVKFATGPTSVVLGAAQAGRSVICRVTAANGTVTAYDDSPAVTILKGNFVNKAKPAISGVLKVGKTLTASTGTWTPAGTSYTYQWKRGSVVIGRAKTYKATSKDKGKILTLVVTAKRAGYNDKAVSVNSRRIG